MTSLTHNIAEILLVEDSPSDVLMTRNALEQTKISHNINVVEDGNEAIAYLRHTGKYSNVARPNLILLDLNLPGKTGHQVLQEIKTDPDLKMIPVIILSTSVDGVDVTRAYGSYANCYVAKPVEFENFSSAIRSIQAFWFSTAVLPEEVV